MSDRGVSVTVDYVVLLMIATVLLAGVASVSATMIDSQIDGGVEEELRVTGERLATDVQDVERLVVAGDDQQTTLELQTDLPRHVSGETYRIVTRADGNELELYAPARGINVTTPVASDRLEETDGSLAGGSVVVNASDGSIEVHEP